MLIPLDMGHHPIGPPAAQRVTIEDGRNTYLLANFPGPKLVGQMSVSSQPSAAPAQRGPVASAAKS